MTTNVGKMELLDELHELKADTPSPLSATNEASVFVWWNVWLDNFETPEREQMLTERLDGLIGEHSPAVVSLQEVVAGRSGASIIESQLANRGYAAYFEPVSPLSSDLNMGNLIATRLPHSYLSFDCGMCGPRRTSLQVLELRGTARPLAIGNTHWLMMRPAFEFHRWQQLTRIEEAIDSLSEAGVSLIVGGDLNTARRHPYMARLKHRYNLLPGDGPTWRYGARSRVIKARLDHVFSTQPVTGSCQVLDAGPSDHCPLLARLA